MDAAFWDTSRIFRGITGNHASTRDPPHYNDFYSQLIIGLNNHAFQFLVNNLALSLYQFAYRGGNSSAYSLPRGPVAR